MILDKDDSLWNHPYLLAGFVAFGFLGILLGATIDRYLIRKEVLQGMESAIKKIEVVKGDGDEYYTWLPEFATRFLGKKVFVKVAHFTDLTVGYEMCTTEQEIDDAELVIYANNTIVGGYKERVSV